MDAPFIIACADCSLPWSVQETPTRVSAFTLTAHSARAWIENCQTRQRVDEGLNPIRLVTGANSELPALHVIISIQNNCTNFCGYNSLACLPVANGTTGAQGFFPALSHHPSSATLRIMLALSAEGLARLVIGASRVSTESNSTSSA
jgi:hypothetical protein